jgi:hypothetical protein
MADDDDAGLGLDALEVVFDDERSSAPVTALANKSAAPESGSDPRRERRARPRDRAGVAREAVRACDQQDWAFRHRQCARVTSILSRLTPPSSGRRHGRGLAGGKRLQRGA